MRTMTGICRRRWNALTMTAILFAALSLATTSGSGLALAEFVTSASSSESPPSWTLSASTAVSDFFYDNDAAAAAYMCENFVSSETVRIPVSAGSAVNGRLMELHVRLNIEGEIEIQDGPYGMNRIQIELERSSPSEVQNNRIIMNQTLFDVGHGTIFVLQVDYAARRWRSRLGAVIGSSIAGAVGLAVLSLVVWWTIYRRRCMPAVGRGGGSGDGGRRTEATTAVNAGYNSGTVDRCYEHGTSVDTVQTIQRSTFCRRGSDADSGVHPAAAGYGVGGGGPGGGGPRAGPRAGPGLGPGGGTLSRGTLMTLSVVSILSVVYSTCPVEPRARIVLVVPPTARLDAIKLFFNRAHINAVITDRWANRNTTQLNIFELNDASATDKAPCSAHTVCPNAYVQSLAGCDAASGQCVCQAGYIIERGVCMDVDECMEGLSRCSAAATCHNTIGSHVCRCSYGFYGDSNDCHSCSVGCPSGTYESSPCTNVKDRICSACTQCQGSAYEVRPCTAVSDRHCLHVAHPLLMAGKTTMPAFLDGMKVEASSNVILEDLHSTRNLETTYYVTDMTQASDFYWDRESGLRVNIGILNVHLIPEYKDVEHDGDNKYMLSNPNNSEDKTKFRNVVRNYCRNPIPDYYSITLEISRDRTTAAEEIVCNGKDPTRPRCPPGYSDGDTFLRRSLNEACQKMGTFPEPLQPAANSIVCTDSSALLRDVFNQSFGIQRPIRFPPKKCRTAASRCEQCLGQPRCLALDVFEKKCCQVDCYTLADCKLMVSDECTSVPVECAMGDAYRYTIQSVFQNIKSEFQCHVELQRPHDILYEMFFFVQIAGTQFQTPKMHRTVRASDLGYQSRGEFQADYLTIEHNTGIELHDEFILVGKESKAGKMNFTVHTLKTEEEFRRRRAVIHEISHNIYVASTQFERPFDYSTSSWVRDNDCAKNVSKLKAVQKHFSDADPGQPVNVAMLNPSGSEQFGYFLKSVSNPPYIRFTVPGNKSILPFYFENNGPLLVLNDSLTAELELTSQGRIWEIRISGYMTGCPAYLGVVINNRLELDELFRYDLLILCPAQFNLTFKVPNWGHQPDKTFDIQLTDSRRTHDVYLTQLVFDPTNHVVIGPEAARDTRHSTVALLPVVFLIVGGICLSLLFALAIAFVYRETAKSSVYYDKDESAGAATSAVVVVYDEATRTPATSRRRAIQTRSSRTLMTALYFAFCGVYSVIFTFTALSLLVVTLTGSDVIQLRGGAPAIRAAARNVTHGAGQTVDRHAVAETVRLEQAVAGAQRACSDFYVNELFAGVAALMDDATTAERETISRTLRRRTSALLDVYRGRLDARATDYRSNLTSAVAAAVTAYRKYLRRVMNGDWLSFPRRLFNDTTVSTGGKERPLILAASDDLLGDEADFGAFIEIEEVESVQLWPVQFWERFAAGLPAMPSLPLPTLNHSSPHCQLDGSRLVPNVTRMVPLDRLDSSHFISTGGLKSAVDESTSFIDTGLPPPRQSSGNVAEEYRLLSDEPTGGTSSSSYSSSTSNQRNSDADRRRGFIDQFDLDAMRIVFLLLDALLLIYRITNVYVGGVLVSRRFGVDGSTDGSAGSPLSSPSKSSTPAVTHGALLELRSGDARLQSADDTQTTMIGHHNPHPHQHHEMTDYPPPPRPTMHNNSENYVGGAGGEVLCCRTVEIKDDVPPNEDLRRCEVTRLVLGQMLESSALPKAIIAVVLTLVFYVVARSVVLVLDVGLLSSVDAFGVYVDAVRVRVNQTNGYIEKEARHLNELATAIYSEQMRAELVNLQALVEFFNAEQSRLTKNYAAEVCAAKKRSLDNNWTCDVTASPSRLEVPMLPCNFIPVQPRLYAGFSVDDYETELNAALLPVITAVKSVIIRVSYVALAVVSSILAVHVASCFLFHHFRLADAPPGHRRRRVYVTAHAPTIGSTGATSVVDPCDGGRANSGPQYDNPCGRTARRGEAAVVDEYDSGDEAGSDLRHIRPPPPAAAGPPRSILQDGGGATQVALKARTSNTLLSQTSLDFKYSETKV